MGNLLLEEIQYKIDQTSMGTWRRYVYPNGTSYHEFTSHKTCLGLPFIHYTYGRNPQTGKRVVAKGFIAVGRIACGIIAIGHASLGFVALGQLALGFVFGFGQLASGIVAIGQAALAIFLGMGQFATGYIAIGQIALGTYVLAQAGFGRYVWSMTTKSAQALEFFRSLPVIRHFIP
jgi:hypothetical protein